MPHVKQRQLGKAYGLFAPIKAKKKVKTPVTKFSRKEKGKPEQKNTRRKLEKQKKKKQKK